MKVITINEDNHGFLGVAKDYKSAIQFLIEEDWINEATEIYVDVEGGWLRLDEYFDDWKSEIENMSREYFDGLFYESFSLEDIDVYGS